MSDFFFPRNIKYQVTSGASRMVELEFTPTTVER